VRLETRMIFFIPLLTSTPSSPSAAIVCSSLRLSVIYIDPAQGHFFGFGFLDLMVSSSKHSSRIRLESK